MTPAPEVLPVNIHFNGRGHLRLAHSIRSLRLRNGLSQRQLALRMAVPRPTCRKSKTKRPTPHCLRWIDWPRALEVSVPDLLSGGERSRQEEVRELMEDQFVPTFCRTCHS